MSRSQQLRPANGRRFAYVRHNILELMIGVLAVVSSLTYFFAPTATESLALKAVLGERTGLWSLTYLVGGLCITYGLVRPNPRIELAGLLFLTGDVIFYATGLGAFYGVVSLRTILVYVAFVIAFSIRAYDIWRALQHDVGS